MACHPWLARVVTGATAGPAWEAPGGGSAVARRVRAFADVAYAAATVVYVVFTTVYVVGTPRHERGGFHLHVRHPLFGPLTAYVPVIAILLVAHCAPDLRGRRPLAVLGRRGRLLLVASGRHHHRPAFFGSPLPQPFVPVLSILLSPPATASLAWFAVMGGEIDQLQAAVGGITLFTLLSQLFFLPDYLRLPFSSQHWVFTFPLAVMGNIGIRWAAGLGFTGWEAVAWTVLAVSTAAILAILAGTLRDCGRWLSRRVDPPRVRLGCFRGPATGRGPVIRPVMPGFDQCPAARRWFGPAAIRCRPSRSSRKGRSHELHVDTDRPHGPRLDVAGAEPPVRVHRHLHQPVRPGQRHPPARCHRRRRTAAAAGPRLARELVRLAAADAGPGRRPTRSSPSTSAASG